MSVAAVLVLLPATFNTVTVNVAPLSPLPVAGRAARVAQRYPGPARRPRPHATAGAAAGAARDAPPPPRPSSSCDLPAPSAARSPSGRSTAGSPAGESTRPPAPADPPAARTGHHPLPWQQRLPHLDRVSQTHHDRGSRTSTRYPSDLHQRPHGHELQLP